MMMMMILLLLYTMMKFWHCIVKNESFILTIYVWLYKDSVTNLSVCHECKGTNKSIGRWDYDYSNNGKFSDGFCISQLWSVGILSQIYMPGTLDWPVGSFINTLNILIKEIIPLHYIYKKLLWN